MSKKKKSKEYLMEIEGYYMMDNDIGDMVYQFNKILKTAKNEEGANNSYENLLLKRYKRRR